MPKETYQQIGQYIQQQPGLRETLMGFIGMSEEEMRQAILTKKDLVGFSEEHYQYGLTAMVTALVNTDQAAAAVNDFMLPDC